jgi:hypothetical protein
MRSGEYERIVFTVPALDLPLEEAQASEDAASVPKSSAVSDDGEWHDEDTSGRMHDVPIDQLHVLIEEADGDFVIVHSLLVKKR